MFTYHLARHFIFARVHFILHTDKKNVKLVLGNKTLQISSEFEMVYSPVLLARTGHECRQRKKRVWCKEGILGVNEVDSAILIRNCTLI